MLTFKTDSLSLDQFAGPTGLTLRKTQERYLGELLNPSEKQGVTPQIRYRTSSYELLRVNVLVGRAHPRRGEVFHVDSLDLYSARARGVFARAAGEELGVAEELIA